MELKIATHNGIFHADEVTAIALLKVFKNDNISVTRLKHDTKDFSSFDMVIDIGKRYDKKRYFDHHQYEGGKSSAGLIWEYLGLESKYPSISKLIQMVDEQDVGIKKAKPFEYPNLIKHFNHNQNIYAKEQDMQFEKAVDFAMTMINSMVDTQKKQEEAKNIVSNSYYFDNNPKIIELDRFTPFWSRYINGDKMPWIKAVVWEDETEQNIKMQIAPARAENNKLKAKKLTMDDSMEFVHSGGFLAIAKDRETMKKYIQKQKI